jgi:carbon starvation protein CstA
MLMESFAIMAMVAASVIEPGVFRHEQPGRRGRRDAVSVAQTVSSWGLSPRTPCKQWPGHR